MKLQHKKHFFLGVSYLVLAIVSFVGSVLQNFNLRFLIAGGLLVLLGVLSLGWAFSDKSLEEEVSDEIDERDIHIIRKSTQTATLITNRLFAFGVFLALLIYAIFKNQILLAIAITLCVAIVIQFVVLLCVNGYYEKRE